MKVVGTKELREKKGLRFSAKHLRHMVRTKQFPAPFKIGERAIAWDEADVDAWLESRKTQKEIAE